jgi:excisionase family DNA binding protein
MPIEDYPPVMDVPMVAELLRLNVETVRVYVREGRLPAYQLPGSRSYLFLRDELLELIRSHPVRPASGQAQAGGGAAATPAQRRSTT